MRFNGVAITPEIVQETRRWFADNALGCIADVESGVVRVNDREAYVTWKREAHDRALTGDFDHSLAFAQRAYWLQTGESVALLPRARRADTVAL